LEVDADGPNARRPAAVTRRDGRPGVPWAEGQERPAGKNTFTHAGGRRQCLEGPAARFANPASASSNTHSYSRHCTPSRTGRRRGGDRLGAESSGLVRRSCSALTRETGRAAQPGIAIGEGKMAPWPALAALANVAMSLPRHTPPPRALPPRGKAGDPSDPQARLYADPAGARFRTPKPRRNVHHPPGRQRGSVKPLRGWRTVVANQCLRGVGPAGSLAGRPPAEGPGRGGRRESRPKTAYPGSGWPSPGQPGWAPGAPGKYVRGQPLGRGNGHHQVLVGTARPRPEGARGPASVMV